MISVGPCAVWTSASEVTGQCIASSAEVIPDLPVIEAAIESASEYLFERSARQFPGVCTAVLRPVPPYINGEQSGSHNGPRRPRSEIDLSVYPIVAIDEVLIDGVAVDPSEYQVQGQRLLVRMATAPDYVNDGWPTEQHMDRAPTEPGTWQVTVQYGVAPPALGVLAANVLAWELVKACTGQHCRIATAPKTINRQGVIIKAIDPNTLPPGRIGIQELDLFLAAYNPANLQRKPQVWTPDRVNRVRRITWPS